MEDLESVKLTDLFSKGSLQSLQDSFSDATGMAALAVNVKEAVTKWSNLTEFGSTYLKKMPDDHVKHATKAAEEAKLTGKPVIFETHLGFTEFIVPILLQGRFLGHFVGGQVLTMKPGTAEIQRFATSHGMEAAQTIEQFNKLAVVPEHRINSAALLLFQLASELADDCYQHLVAAEHGRLAKENMGDTSDNVLMQRIGSTVDLVKRVESGCGHIKNEVMNSTRAVENTDAIVKTIENSSTQLTLIGFNASIEAKRAGAAGAGFNVIAQEVRTLADKNTKQAVEIEHTLNGIKRSMGDINGQIRSLYEDIEKIVDSINELSYAVMDAEKEKNKE